VGGLGSACSDFSSERTIPPRGTLGAELFGLVCDRLGGQSLHEDLSGASYRTICHPDGSGTYSDTVDTTLLPPLVDGQPDIDGNPVTLAKQTSDRNYGIARLQTMAKHRADLIRALDATFPDASIPVVDVTNADPTKSCAPNGQGRLHTELSTLLGHLQDLYTDGTIPQATESLGRLVNAFTAATDAQGAWARFDARQGYRPIDVALGVGRPVLAYPGLRDFANATLAQLSPDSKPYAPNPQYDAAGNRILIPGAAYKELTQLLGAAQAELANSTADPPDPFLSIGTDPTMGGRLVLSRPRTDLEFLQSLLYREDAAFGAGSPQYIVQRDPRGYALVGTTNGKVPPPFVDNDGDGLADVNAEGLFITSNGQPAPSPFFAVGAPNAAARDSFNRALDAPNGNLVYHYIDTSHVYTASLMGDLQTLVDPDPNHQRETLMDVAAGGYVVFGSRDGASNTIKSYPGGEQVSYNAFHTDDSPLIDLIYAAGQILADPTADQTLAFAKTIVEQHTNDLARLAGDALYAKSLADQDNTAKIPPASTLWDDMIDSVVRISEEPGLLEDLIRAFGDDATLPLANALAGFMTNKDHISYDHKNVNGPVFNYTTNTSDPPKTPVDRAQPDARVMDPSTKRVIRDNRSEFQAFLQVVHDGNGVAVCNKPGAIIHGRGIPILGSVSIPSGNAALIDDALSLIYGKRTFDECELLKIDNLAYFTLDTIIGQATLYIRDNFLRNGLQLPGLGYIGADVGLLEVSSGIGTDSVQGSETTANADRYNGPDLMQTGFWDLAASKTSRPKFPWGARFLLFDTVNDSPNPGDINYVTNHFIADLRGDRIGASICPERVIPDPCVTSKICRGVTDILPDGNVHGLRSCKEGDWLSQRDQDAAFSWEEYGFLKALSPILNAFVVSPNPQTGAPRRREDLFVGLMETLNKHWQSAQGAQANPDECVLGGTAKCSQDGAVTYEPLLSQIFSTDMVTALHDFVGILKNVTVPTCAATDPKTHLCTQPGSMDGVRVLTNATYALINPKHAASLGLKDRKGNVTSLRNDGSTNAQVTPLYLLLETLDEIDQAFAKYAQANPNDTGRQAQWRHARSRLVDQFFGVKNQNTTSQAFTNQPMTKIAPVLLDLLRAQLLAHCPTTANASNASPCTWASKDLWTHAATTIGGPTFATAVDLADAIRKDTSARTQSEALLHYLLNSGSNNDALASLLGATDDIVQVMRDDTNLVPFYHVMATAMSPTTTDSQGNVQRGVVDASTTFLARVAARAYDTNQKEICTNELDPNGVLTAALGRLLTPMQGQNEQPGEAPLEVILDAIADINRAAPGDASKLTGTDYGNMANELQEFLLDGTRGLEQFYAIVRNGTKR
jgi:hypothetical protein